MSSTFESRSATIKESTSLIKLTKKNYTSWRLAVTIELRRLQLFEAVAVEHINRPKMNYERRNTLRSMRQDCIDYLLQVVDQEIYEEIKNFNSPFQLWMYLQEKYSRSAIRRLHANVRELQAAKFTFENFDIFIEKFKKIVRKIAECGLELEDKYLNLYLINCLERSKRILDTKEFVNEIDCKFDEFTSKIRLKITPSQDNQYSDISNESMSFTDDENDQELDDMKIKIDETIQQYDQITDTMMRPLKSDEFNYITSQSHDKQIDLADQVGKLDNDWQEEDDYDFDKVSDEQSKQYEILNLTKTSLEISLTSTSFRESVPGNLSPIKKYPSFEWTSNIVSPIDSDQIIPSCEMLEDLRPVEISSQYLESAHQTPMSPPSEKEDSNIDNDRRQMEAEEYSTTCAIDLKEEEEEDEKSETQNNSHHYIDLTKNSLS